MMSRVTDNEAIQAARALKGYCASHAICAGCVFQKTNRSTVCGIISPPTWSIPDLTPVESQDSKRLREREEFLGRRRSEKAQKISQSDKRR